MEHVKTLVLFSVAFIGGGALVRGCASDYVEFNRGWALGYNSCRDELPEPEELK